MNILQIGITIFIMIECLNVLTLYFAPESKYGNGLGVFKQYEKAKENQPLFTFITYLIHWVAGAKLIFIVLGIIVVIFGSETVQLYTVFGFILSISSFYFRLYPAIKKMDSDGELVVPGYSKTLNIMIVAFLLFFIVELVVYWVM